MHEVIARVDAVRPNIYDAVTKGRWIANLEGMIARTVLDQDVPEYLVPEDIDVPLLVGAPYDDVYDLYVMSMIELMNKEYDHYNNAAAVFQSRLQEYKEWYIRRNAQGRAQNFRNVMG